MGLKHMQLKQNFHEHLIVLKPSECKHAVYLQTRNRGEGTASIRAEIVVAMKIY